MYSNLVEKSVINPAAEPAVPRRRVYQKAQLGLSFDVSEELRMLEALEQHFVKTASFLR